MQNKRKYFIFIKLAMQNRHVLLMNTAEPVRTLMHIVYAIVFTSMLVNNLSNIQIILPHRV